MTAKPIHLSGTDYLLSELKTLREQAGLPQSVPLRCVGAVIDKANGDFDLALDALTMLPRPRWVSETLGLHPEREVGA